MISSQRVASVIEISRSNIFIYDSEEVVEGCLQQIVDLQID